MPYIEQDEFARLLLIAVNEAEEWYDECRGFEPGQRLAELADCYAVLDASRLKTRRESQRCEAPEPHGKRHPQR